MKSGCGLYLAGPGYGPLTDYCENCNEPADSIRTGGLLDHTKDKQLLK
jgi:hypothetical protein